MCSPQRGTRWDLETVKTDGYSRQNVGRSDTSTKIIAFFRTGLNLRRRCPQLFLYFFISVELCPFCTCWQADEFPRGTSTMLLARRNVGCRWVGRDTGVETLRRNKLYSAAWPRRCLVFPAARWGRHPIGGSALLKSKA